MNSSAGVGGPAVSLYAVNAGWTVREFVPNAQFYGLLVNLLSITVKGIPQLSPPSWSLITGGIIMGTVTGSVLATRTPEDWARRIVLAIALCGGLSTVVKGLFEQ